jgi:hypothetical protein
MITEDKGFVSKYDGICMVCKAYYHTGDKIATAPVPYHVHRPKWGRAPIRSPALRSASPRDSRRFPRR